MTSVPRRFSVFSWRLPRRNAIAASVMNSAANRFEIFELIERFQPFGAAIRHVGQRQIEALQRS